MSPTTPGQTLLFLGGGGVLHGAGRAARSAGRANPPHAVTAWAALAGVAASRSPPSPPSGFVSEWLLLQAFSRPGFSRIDLPRFRTPRGGLLASGAWRRRLCRVCGWSSSAGRAARRRERSRDAAAPANCPGAAAALCILGGLLGSFAAAAMSPVLELLFSAHLPGLGTGPTAFSLVAFELGAQRARRPDHCWVRSGILNSNGVPSALDFQPQNQAGATLGLRFPDPCP